MGNVSGNSNNNNNQQYSVVDAPPNEFIGYKGAPISVSRNAYSFTSGPGDIVMNRHQLTVLTVGIAAGAIGAGVATYLYYARKRRYAMVVAKEMEAKAKLELRRMNQAEEEKTRISTLSTLARLKLSGELVGRDALLADIITWIRSSVKHQRMWLIIGSAGTGKSAISVGLSRLLREDTLADARVQPTALAIDKKVRVLHHHICVASDESTMTRDAFIASLVRSCRLADVLVGTSGRTTPTTPRVGVGEPTFGSLHALFRSLPSTPQLKEVDVAYVIIIDGLDESPLIAALLTYDTLTIMPSWLKIMATSRPVVGPSIPRAVTCTNVREMILEESPSQRTAIVAFINDRLPPILAAFNITGDGAQKLVNELIDRSGMSFMYAQCVMNDIKHGTSPPTSAALSALPRDLNGYYYQSFVNRWPLVMPQGHPPPSYNAARVLLETRMIDASMIDSQRTGCRSDEIEIAELNLNPFMKHRDDDSSLELIFIHKSFGDWLSARHNPYHIDRERGQVRVTVYHVLHHVPVGFSWDGTPQLYRVMCELLGCDPTMCDTTKSSTSDATIARASIINDFYASLITVPTPYALKLMYALEAERAEIGGKGFWDMNVPMILNSVLRVYHIAVMPERFMHREANDKKDDTTTGLSPLDCSTNRITHINGEAVTSNTFIDRLQQLTLRSVRSCTVTVMRGQRSTSFSVVLLSSPS